MQLKLYNTQTKKQQIIDRNTPKKILVYSCGPTVYKEVHIGNLRAYVFADTLNRALRFCGHQVEHVINITDVGHLTDDADAGEDKIEKQAQQEGRSATEIAQTNTNLFFTDLLKLHIAKDRYRFPRATDYIQEQITLIQKLESKGFTYETEDGIYFDTGAYPEYGALGLSLADDENTHARVTTTTQKKNPHDFALWKKTPTGTTRQQEWQSPWGTGFPGWHIECSAMVMSILSETIDIHTGGMDHIAIHHNNEIAQSEAATQKTFARLWMHTAFLTEKNEKLSKSKGTAHTLTDIETMGYRPTALRYLFLQSSYKTPLSFSFQALQSAQTALERFEQEYRSLPHSLLSRCNTKKSTKYVQQINEAVIDDLNTAAVLAIVWNIVHDTEMKPIVKRNTIRYADRVLGLLDGIKISKPQKEETVPKEIAQLLIKRDAAREAGNYAEADALRDRIVKHGYQVLDGPKKTSVQSGKKSDTLK